MGTRELQARGGNKDGMALGDLDRDGYLDLIGPIGMGLPPTANGVTSAYLGNGDGTFVEKGTPPVAYASAWTGWYSALADLNRDGILDLAATSTRADSVGVHLGVGDGSFVSGVDYAIGPSPAGIVLADVDGDGTRDLVVAAEKGAALGLCRGRGDGSFGALESLPMRGFPRIVIQTDWNGDELPDLIANDDYLHVLLGTGAGSFNISDCGTAISHFSRGGSPQAAVVADFDQDGSMDLGVGNGVLFAMSGCNFESRFDHTSWFPLVAEDFDGDGLPDLLAGTADGLEVLTSDGKRGFVAEAHVDGFSQPDAYAAVAGDLDGDGRIDAVVSGYGGVRVLMNTCR